MATQAWLLLLLLQMQNAWLNLILSSQYITPHVSFWTYKVSWVGCEDVAYTLAAPKSTSGEGCSATAASAKGENKRKSVMNFDSFKQDIDELIGEFAQEGLTTLADMKRVWLSKNFSYIYQASPSSNLAFFMQSLFAHCIGYMVGTASLSHRLGGLYSLYCLYEVQPYKPPFRVYLSLGELAKLKILVVDAKANNIEVVPALVKRMLDRNTFLYGAVDLRESFVTETVNQLQQVQNTRVEVAYEKLFKNTQLENYIHMDLGMEVDLNLLKKKSSEYAKAKGVAIKEASNIIDVENIKHITEDKEPIGEAVEKIADEWVVQKETFYNQTGLKEDDGYDLELEQLLLDNNEDDEESNEE